MFTKSPVILGGRRYIAATVKASLMKHWALKKKVTMASPSSGQEIPVRGRAAPHFLVDQAA